MIQPGKEYNWVRTEEKLRKYGDGSELSQRRTSSRVKCVKVYLTQALVKNGSGQVKQVPLNELKPVIENNNEEK